MSEYRTIDINEYVRTGEGGTAVSYKHKSRNTLAKLYNPGFEADSARAEFLTARAVFELGISTPEPICLVTDGERFGAEYEFIPGKRSFARIISEEPDRLEEISLTFAREARKLHETKADTTRLRSCKDRIRQFYLEKDMVPEEYKRRALFFLESVLDTPYCVHGDLHIGNIITNGAHIWWIDVGEFAYGEPEWDLTDVDYVPQYEQGYGRASLPRYHGNPECSLECLSAGLSGNIGPGGTRPVCEAFASVLCLQSSTHVGYGRAQKTPGGSCPETD